MSIFSDVRRAHASRVVTGLYGLADAGASQNDPERLAAQLLEGGCRLIQLRCKDWSDEDILIAGRGIWRRCQAADAALFINDHTHIARTLGATGVHLGQVDGPLPPRASDDALLIGRSTHNPEQARRAVQQGADYIAFGPVFHTPHLSRHKPIRGATPLPAVRNAIPANVPLVAIGGIRPQNIAELQRVGVNAWAIIGAIALAADPVQATRDLLPQSSGAKTANEGPREL
ncbi:MAG: thiamine phosphate synthase [Rhodobacterales bacterium]|nr:thiamine phosphate synthase [Rhodobacterales bacterium]